MELLLIALLGLGIASLVVPESEDIDNSSNSNLDMESDNPVSNSGTLPNDLLEEIGGTVLEEVSVAYPDQSVSDEDLHVEVEENSDDTVQIDPFSLESEAHPAFGITGGDVTESVDDDSLLSHPVELDEDAVSSEDSFLPPETDGEKIGIPFSRYSNDDEIHIEVPENLSGSVHRVDVEVRYEYSASYAGETQNSDVTREFTFYILSPDKAPPDLDIKVESVYDLRDYVDFGSNPFGDSTILAAIDNGGVRETDFITISDINSDDNAEHYDVESRDFVTNYSPGAIVSDREVVSTQRVVIEFDGEVEEY